MLYILVGTVKYLLSLGADPSLHGKWGKIQGTPLEFAKKRNFPEIRDILQEYMKEHEAMNNEEEAEGV